MEATLLDSDRERYDPEVLSVERSRSRVILVLEHGERSLFSLGDRAWIILASDTYEDGSLYDIIKKRRVVETVVGECVKKLSDDVLCWEIANVSAVEDVLDADVTIAGFD